MKKLLFFIPFLTFSFVCFLPASAHTEQVQVANEVEGDEYPIVVQGTGFTTDMPVQAAGGKEITFTVTLEQNYVIKTVSAWYDGLYGSGNITVTNVSGTTYKFTMPEEGESLYYAVNNDYGLDPDSVTVKIETEQQSSNPRVIIADSRITSSSADAVAGQTVTVTIRPADNDRMTRLTVNGQNISFSSIVENLNETLNADEAYDWQFTYTYTFTMPNQDVAVSAAYETTFGIITEYATNCTIDVPHRAAVGEAVTVKVNPNAGYTWEGDISIHDSNYLLYVENPDALDENNQFVMPDDLYSTDLDYIYIGAICVEDLANGLDNAGSTTEAVKFIDNGRLLIRHNGRTFTTTGVVL